MITEDAENEVIKVKNLVAKWENEIKKQDPNNTLFCSVRQVLDLSLESRKSCSHHPLEDVPETNPFQPMVYPKPYIKQVVSDRRSSNVSNELQKPRSKLNQFKDKCSEIITKNVRKSKIPPVHPRPQSLSGSGINCSDKSLSRTKTAPSKTSTKSKTKNIELKDVDELNNIRQKSNNDFEIINANDCFIDTSQLYIEPIDLRTKRTNYRSVESLDSGYDTNTPRNSETRFSVSTPEYQSDKNFDELRNCFEKECEFNNEGKNRNNVCIDDSSPNEDYRIKDNIVVFTSRPRSQAVTFFDPGKTETEESLQYLETLRSKLRTHVISKRQSVDLTVSPITEQPLSEALEEERQEKDGYQDHELDDLLYRCFKIINPITSKLRYISDDLLIECFTPKQFLLDEYTFDSMEYNSSRTAEEMDVLSEGEISLDDY